MISDEKIRGFLSKEENLSVALAVVRELKPLKARLHRMFWSEFVSFMKVQLNDQNREYTSNWKLKLSPEDNTDKWVTFDILPDSDYLKGAEMLAFVRLEQRDQTVNFAFRYGVMSPILNDSDENIASIKEARKKLLTWGFKIDGRSPWWLGLKQLEPNARGDEFLLAMAGDSRKFVHKFADNVWKLFIDIEATLREVNHDLNRDALQSEANSLR